MTHLLDILTIVAPFAALFFAVLAYVFHRRIQEANDRANHMHAELGRSVIAGHPLVTFRRNPPLPPGADASYTQVRIAGREHLFTDSAVKVARDRAKSFGLL